MAEITADDLKTLALSPQSASGDQGAATARKADDVLKLLDRAAAMQANTSRSSPIRMQKIAAGGAP
jgi:hypothetical protein